MNRQDWFGGAGVVLKIHRSLYSSLIVFSLFLSLPLLEAHEQESEQIKNLTEKIRANPDDPNLYLKRGELYRETRQWNKALADYRQAERVDPEVELADYYRGRLYADKGQFLRSERYLNRFLARQPEHADAILERARLYLRTKRYEKAAEDYEIAFSKLFQVKPEYYIEYAEVLSADGKLQKALSVLDAGVQRLGPIVTLQLPAIELDIRLKQYDKALQRVQTLQEQSSRKEHWLARRGEILRLAGRREEAVKMFHEAIIEIDSLPSNLRNSAATRQLENEVRTSLGELEKNINQQSKALP